MEGLEIGTLYALLQLDDSQFTQALSHDTEQLRAFGSAGELAAQEFGSLPQKLVEAAASSTQLATSAGDAAIKQAAMTEAAVGTAAALPAAGGAALDAKAMFAQLKAEAMANSEANIRFAQTTDNIVLSMIPMELRLAAGAIAWESLGLALGAVSLAVLAFGPRIYELIGGMDGLKRIGEELESLFGDLAVIAAELGGVLIDRVALGLEHVFTWISDLGGAIVDLVAGFLSIASANPIVSGLVDGFGYLRDVIHALAADPSLQSLNDQLNDLVPDGFGPGSLSAGIDPNDTAAISAFVRETDALIAANDPLRATWQQLKNIEGALTQELTPAMAASLGITLETKDAQVRLKDASKMTFEEMLRWAGSSGIVGGIEDVMLASKDLTYQLTQMGGGMSTIVTPGITNMNASFTEAGGSASNLLVNTSNLTGALTALPLQPLNQNVAESVYQMNTWDQELVSITESFLFLGQAIPGVTGSVLTMIGQMANAFLFLKSAVDSVQASWGALTRGFGQLSDGSIFSGISSMMTGISGLVGLAGSAISVFSALGSAIKRAFTSEETELVNPNRDLFFAQFLGSNQDPYTALGESAIQAAMAAYGVDRDTAFSQYVDPLIRALYEADTFGEFQAAQSAIGELFKRAGVTINLFNEAGIATQYRSSVFENAVPTYTSLPSPSYTSTYPTGTGAPAGGTIFGTGTNGTQIGMGGGMCITIQNVYVGGASGQEQASSFFEQLVKYIQSGGSGMSQFRNLVCQATA